MLIIGAGPCGLRMAIEMQYLGAETTVIETRPYFDRNNVLKLWTFVMERLKFSRCKEALPAARDRFSEPHQHQNIAVHSVQDVFAAGGTSQGKGNFKIHRETKE